MECITTLHAYHTRHPDRADAADNFHAVVGSYRAHSMADEEARTCNLVHATHPHKQARATSIRSDRRP